MLIDLGQESYQKKSFDAHRYEIPTTQSSWHNLPTIGEIQPGKPATQTGPASGQITPGDGVDQGVGPLFRATDVTYHADEAMAELSMELREAYSASARVKSWRRSVRLVRAANRVEIGDSYSLLQPLPVTLKSDHDVHGDGSIARCPYSCGSCVRHSRRAKAWHANPAPADQLRPQCAFVLP